VGSGRLRERGPEQQPLLLVARGYRKEGRPVTVAVAEDLTDLTTGLRRLQVTYGAVSGAGLILLLLVQRLIVGLAFRPLARVRASLGRLERGEATRLDASGPSEVTPLIAELNRLLSAMVVRSRRSRDALGNLAHALKTRLAVLGQISDLPELEAHPGVRGTIEDSTEGMRRIVERELRRARLMGDGPPGRRVEVADEVRRLCETLQGLYRDKSPTITVDVAPGVRFPGDREDLLELLGNLLDNACQWCRTQVRVAARDAEGPVFVVEDDGPGCPVEELGALARRGFRADESRPGSGLGLAIVRDIVEGYGGTLAFGHSASLGGLRVEARLDARGRPASPPAT
jgi:signal transduction histidine kinase